MHRVVNMKVRAVSGRARMMMTEVEAAQQNSRETPQNPEYKATEKYIRDVHCRPPSLS
jgi:hypothetical protein